jgi:ATP-dependent DNA helicase UvrD/PcrA
MPTSNDLTVSTVHTLARGRVERIFGPPGTGKSTTLTHMIKDLVLEHGPDGVMVTSFTVTAAKSIAAMGKGKDQLNAVVTGIADRNVGTLHAMALRVLGHREVALDPKILTDWNTRVRPTWRITPDARRGNPATAEGGEGPGGGDGDSLLAALDMGRSKLLPLAAMSNEVRQFGAAWEAWKREVDAIDYTDMIALALERAIEGERAPGNPQVLVADEAQDMTPLEIALVLAWGAHAQRTILALDDDQAIMSWRGGDPTPILALGTGLNEEPQPGLELETRVLGQSWRIPASVQRVAQNWIELCSRRQPKVYLPRPVEGQVYGVGATIDDMATAQAVARDVAAGRSVMVLAACEYMLRPMLSNLRKLGVPYGNIYRPTEGRWNPLRSPDGMTTAERLYRYLVCDDRALGGWTDEGGRARLWTGDDVRAWLKMVESKSACLSRGAKTVVKQFPANIPLDIALVEGLFENSPEGDESLTRATEPDIEWLMAHVLKGYRDRLTYPVAVASRCGPAALMDEPLVTVGTIHSVKGAGADVVYLSPAISPAGAAEWALGGARRDNTIRQFYVGITRAVQTCVVLNTAERSVPRKILLPPELMVR